MAKVWSLDSTTIGSQQIRQCFSVCYNEAVENQDDNFKVSQSQNPEDSQVENILRPKTLREYIGQRKTKDSLNVFIKAAKIRNEPIEHVLIYGPPGLGKTTLAHVISNELDVDIKVTSGPAIERAGDLISILTSLQDSDVLFIDEIHRLSKIVEEVLYPAMEDYAVDLIIGKGPSAKTLRIDLPKFTLIGATTRMSLISSPMRDRFGIVQSLNFYEDSEMEEILTRSSKILDVPIDSPSVSEIAKRSRKTPRIANRLLKRVRDFALVYNEGKINMDVTLDSLERIGIDSQGLDENDRKLLRNLVEKFDGGPTGVETLCASSSIEKETIETVIEPFLMQTGFLKRTPKGRVATDKAWKYLGIEKKKTS
jgi:Holliday junction DNA helicase RuvB